MEPIFLGTEALYRGEVTLGQLRWRYRQIYPDVYTPKAAEASLRANTIGAFLWSRRRAAITGLAAAALHGSQWVADDAPIELLWENNHPPNGIVTRNERFLVDEATEIDGMVVATPERTAYDLGRHLPRNQAVAQLDALSRATGLTAASMVPLIERSKGVRGIRRLRTAVDLMDGGAQSPKETWLRLLLIDAGYPRPATQIPVLDDFGHAFAYLDMGWEGPQIAVEYDGRQHGSDADQWRWDVRRLRMVEEREWLHVKVIAGDRPDDVLRWVARAWAARRTGESRRYVVARAT
jgi:hypothetical protein